MPGLIRGVARTAAVVGTATAVSGRVSRRQQGRWAAKEQSADPAPEAAPAPVTPAPVAAPVQPAADGLTDDKLAQLKQLGELKDAGVLSDAEFEAQKGKILYA